MEDYKITEDALTGRAIAELLNEHLEHMRATSPPDSVHALDLEALRAPDVTFWSVWAGDDLVGCGALKALGAAHGEIKSMRTARAHLGRGVASAMLRHLIGEARKQGYRRLSLETGTGKAFEPAHALYQKFGFTYCGPFAQYTNDPFSLFMTFDL